MHFCPAFTSGWDFQRARKEEQHRGKPQASNSNSASFFPHSCSTGLRKPAETPPKTQPAAGQDPSSPNPPLCAMPPPEPPLGARGQAMPPNPAAPCGASIAPSPPPPSRGRRGHGYRPVLAPGAGKAGGAAVAHGDRSRPPAWGRCSGSGGAPGALRGPRAGPGEARWGRSGKLAALRSDGEPGLPAKGGSSSCRSPSCSAPQPDAPGARRIPPGSASAARGSPSSVPVPCDPISPPHTRPRSKDSSPSR